MINYFIKEVSARGNGKTPSIIEFGPHLNIIHGESNTGKTIIANSIYYAFGGDVGDHLFDVNRTGYETVGMKISYLDKYEISFERDIGNNKSVRVSSNHPDIPCGDYYIKRDNKNSEKKVLNDLILKIVGLDEVPLIGVKQNSEKEKLSWRSLFYSLYLDKERVDSSDSPILPQNEMKDYRVLSAILFFLSGRDFSEKEKTLSKTEKAIRKKAVHAFVSSQIEMNEPRLKELGHELEEFDEIQNIEQYVKSLDKSIHDTAEMIEKSNKDIENLVLERNSIEEKIAESETMQKRYSALKTQYLADINRLNFIVEGEDVLFAVPKPEKCPFCGGMMDDVRAESCIEAAKIELVRIIKQVEGLQRLESTINEEILSCRQERDRLMEKEKAFKSNVMDSLNKRYSSLLSESNTIHRYIALKSEYDYLNGIKEQLPKVLETYRDPADTGSKRFNPREHFTNEFSKTMDEYLTKILKEIGYPVVEGAHFDKKTFDVEVDGHPKQSNQGQGFCSVFNSALFLALHKYYCCDAVYNPNILMIDTPLLGLEQWEGDVSYLSIRERLYRYLYENRNMGQTIIIDNQEILPSLDYIGGHVRIVEFTKGRRPGRYGYLEDYRED